MVNQRIRRQILEALDQQEVKINEQRLTDVNLIKRLVMKRCVYGVDLNPMAVELAKVSLWLDSFTLGAPLSFLDHHLKCGNSLVGTTIEDLKRAAHGWVFGIKMEPLERATAGLEVVANLTDATLSEVTQSAETYKKALVGVRGYRALLDCLTAEHFGAPGASKLVSQGSDLDLEHWDECVKGLPAKERRWIEQAEKIGRERTFFHWDVDFPDVFFTSRRPEELRRFDAVVGNPPWGGLRTLGDLGSLLGARLRTAKKGTDYFALFVEVELNVLHEKGRLGVVLPSGWQTADESKEFRELIEHQGTIESFVGLPYDTFEDANVDSCILIASRCKEDPHAARVLSYEIRERVTRIDESDWRWCEIDPAVWHAIDPDGHQWLTFMRPSELLVAGKLRQASVRLENLARLIQRGISPYEPVRRSPGRDYELCLDGELRRYTYNFSGGSCVAYHPAIAEYKDRELFEGNRTIVPATDQPAIPDTSCRNRGFFRGEPVAPSHPRRCAANPSSGYRHCQFGSALVLARASLGSRTA